MSDLDTPLVPGRNPEPGASLAALAQDYQALRTAFHVLLFSLIVLTGSLFVFFLKEASIARREVTEYTRAVADFQKNTVPVITDFRAKLEAYSRSHPDFIPIYTKYFGATNLASATALSNPGDAKGQAQPGASPARLPPVPGR
jgi:hypothetical protein